MALGFVLVQVEPGREQEVYQTLQGLDGLVELHPLFGEHDLIAKVEATDLDALGRAIVSNIRTIPGVSSTKTLTVAKL